MKKLLLLLMLLAGFEGISQTADTLYHEDFETGGTSFTLNTADMSSSAGTTGYNLYAWAFQPLLRFQIRNYSPLALQADHQHFICTSPVMQQLQQAYIIAPIWQQMVYVAMQNLISLL